MPGAGAAFPSDHSGESSQDRVAKPTRESRAVTVAYVDDGCSEKAFLVFGGQIWGPFLTTEELREGWRELKSEGTI